VIHRIVPNLNVRDAGAGHDFYVDFLGLEKAVIPTDAPAADLRLRDP
jgi:hypothetical protein